MDTPSELVRLALQVYSNHREAINRIIEAKEVMNVTTWAIDPAIDRRRQEDLLADHHGNKHRRFYSKSLDAVDVLRNGRYWTRSGRMGFENSWNHESQMKGRRQFAIYMCPLLDGQDFSPFDPDGAVRKIESAVADFFEHDYSSIVNAVLEEFGHSELGSE